MSISGVGIANSYLYKNVHKSNHRKSGTAFFDRAGMTITSNPQECPSGRFSVNDAYNSMRMNGKFWSEIGEHYLQSFNANDRSVNLFVQSNGEVQKVENERYVKDVSDKIEGNWCIYDKKSNESFVFYPMSTSIQTDENTGKDYIVSCYPWGGLRNVMYAEGEATGHVVRTGNGIMIVACNGISYIDNNDSSKSWGFMFSENDTDIYNEIMQVIIEGSIKGGMEAVSGWEEWFEEKGHIYEKIFSDEELAAMTNKKETYREGMLD